MTRSQTAALVLCGMSMSGWALAQAATPNAAARGAAARPPLQGICVFSREAMFGTSNISVSSNQRLQQLRDEAQAETDRDRQSLEADTQSLRDGQAGLSPALLKQVQDRLAERSRELGTRAGLRTRELERTRQQVTAQIESAAAPIMQEMERLNGCSVLLTRESVISAPGMVDITPVVIAAMNARLRPAAFQRLGLNSATDGAPAR